MAIGTAAAIGLGLTAVGAGASALSSNAASKRAAQTSQQNTASNVALARDIYGQNKATLSPFVNRGNVAGDQINALLGLGGAPAQQPQMQPNALSQFRPTGYNASGAGDMIGTARGAGLPYGLGDGFVTTGQFSGGAFNDTPPTQQQNPGFQMGGQTAQGAANNAFDIFRNSTGYQFRLGEGMDALNSGYAGAGTLQSGDAIRAAIEYGQNFASNEFGNYLNALGAQQAVGAGSASALAGVGQNFAGTVIGANNANAANQMNAQLSRQNALGNVAGLVGGGLFQYGLGG